MLRVEDAAFGGHWLVTRLNVQTHRDGRFIVHFEASDAEQMWRPSRLTPRPKVHGLLSAQVVGGATLAQLDETGRYRIRYPWQVGGPASDEPPSKVLGATHHGGQPEVVTARDNSRHVIRSGAGNKLRLEDRQGEEHIKLHTPHGNSQLNLGHAVDHQKKPRGQGVELRTELHGAVRSAQQLLITTGHASPRASGEARATHSSAEIRSTLQNLQSFIGNRSTAARQVGVLGHATIASPQWVGDALQSTAQTAIGSTKPNQAHWAQAGQINASPTLSAAATKDLGVWSIGAQDWLARGKLQIAARDATRLHIEQGGRKAFVSEGDHATTVSKGRFHLVVEGSIVVQSQGGDLSLKASGASVILTQGGHAGIKASGSAVYQTQVHTARAPAVMVQGGSSAQEPGGLQSQPLLSNGFSKRFQIKDAATGQIKANTRYWLTANGKTAEGITDAEGYTQTAYTHGSQPLRLEVEEGGLELHS